MRCNYRCNMRCNCKKPAKPYPAAPSISAPTVESLELTPNSGQDINFTYTPTDAELSVSITSSDTNVVQTFPLVYENGSARFNAMGIDEGDATITITNDDNPSETYSVAVHVENVEPFVPANNIIVDVESEGEVAVRKTRSKKVRGSGDTYHARVFAEEYESADYVQLNWGYLATPDVSYVGKTASDEHCVNMFTTDVINNIARNIETLHDGGQLGGSCEFEDVAWLNIQSYFDSPYSQESAEQLVAQLSEGEIIEPINNGATITHLDGDYYEVTNRGGQLIVAYFTPEDGDTSNFTATSSDSEAVSITPAWVDPGQAYFQAYAHSNDAYVTITISDGTNEFTCGVQCLPYISVESISNPSKSEVSVVPNSQQDVYFNYSPAYVTSLFADVIIETNNVNMGYSDAGNGIGAFQIFNNSNEDDGEIRYYLISNPEDVKTITVHNVTPTAAIESLSGVPSEVSQLAPATGRTFEITYSPTDADYIFEQISVQSDTNVVSVGMRNLDTTNHTFLVDYYGVAEGSSYVQFWVGGNIIAQSLVTIERPTIQTISNLQYTNPTQDGGEVYSRGFHSPVTFEYTPTSGVGGLTITKTGGTKVDGTPWDTPGRDVDQSVSDEGIDYNNGVATLNCYVDNEASVGQRGSWRIAVENDPNQYLDVKITFANEPAPSTDCTITVVVNDDAMGSVDVPSVTVPVGTAISYNGNQVTIGSTTVTATANSGYQQRGRSNMIFTATEDATIMAEFEAETPVSNFTAVAVYDNAVNGTITRTGNWEYVSESGAWEIGGLTSEALLTPSEEDGTYTLTIEDGGNTWTFDIVPDNFDDYVGWGGDEGFEITGPTNIYAMPGYLETVNIYPTTITPDPEAQ